MSEHIRKTIGEVQEQIQKMETEVSRKKRMVNDLAELAGLSLIYHDIQDGQAAPTTEIRRDQWYGQPLSTAIREYLEMRRVSNLGPATVPEIYEALGSGGYKFDAKDAENAKRGLRISLTKNSSIFHRLPDKKHYGLLEWYPEAKLKRQRPNGHEALEDDDIEAVDEEEVSDDKKQSEGS